MKVILICDVKNIGDKGEVVELKNGFARNYLIPQKLALQATKENYKKIEELKRREKKFSDKKKNEALRLKEKIEGFSLTINMEVKNDDELYGPVSGILISKALKNEGVEIPKEQLVIKDPIKKLGAYFIEVRLHPEVRASLRVWVVRR